MRPRLLVGVLGTHTEVGKTWVSAHLLALARARGLRVAARKPVQSYDATSLSRDAEQLAAATGENAAAVCPDHRCYPLALAPPMAADLLHRPPILLAQLNAEIVWPQGLDLGLVETVGGPLSPLAHDADSLDLIRSLAVDRIVLVADAGLGTLNAVRLSLLSLAPLDAVVMLNRFDPGADLHRENHRWLSEKYGMTVAISIEALLAHLSD